ncbi:hypothetical protein TL08_03420 [Actinoalloteichus hymeniacidonis]|uniref:Uncharacterized protein n=1 Tax=Actinoalloteichus hymeniacidonis TaxID=340345 RepID=A0AAC9MWY9_9PSEU|nr:hypothetical protein TL08_03420 [Actinoalloteichus hymeniacidonis]
MSTLDIVRYSLLFAHIVGLSAIIGSYILQMPWKRNFDFLPLVIGAIVAIITGCGLIATREVGGLGVDQLKMIVKLGLALVVGALSMIGLLRSRRLGRADADDSGLKPLLLGAGMIAMANVIVALFWR